MNRRLFPLALIMAPAVFAYACSSSSSNPDNPVKPGEEGGPGADQFVPATDGPSGSDGPMGDQFVPPGSNPIDGVAATPKAEIPGVAFEGPSWAGDGLYLSAYTAAPNKLLKYTPGVTVGLTNPAEIRDPVTAGSIILGTTLDGKTGTLLTIEVPSGTSGGQLSHTQLMGALPRTGTPVALAFDGGGGLPFDSPNDVVVHKATGTIYLSDPGYQTDQNLVTTNHIWRIKPTGEVIEIQVDGRPNGIALSPTQNLLYISFTVGISAGPGMPATVPNIYKYAVNADGSLGAGSKFADVTPASSAPDGLAVDTSGNVYVAVSTGVDVFKADGSAKWGHINSGNKPISGLAFGGADKKTLFMTSDQGLFSVVVKVAGLPE